VRARAAGESPAATQARSRKQGLMAIDTSKTIATAGSGDTTANCWSCGRYARRPVLPRLRQSATALAGELFFILRLAAQTEPGHVAPGAGLYELSRKLHPDLNARADKREQEWSLEQSSLLNDAYRTLKDPIKRTQYLLRLEGVELEEQSKTATERARTSGESQETDCASGLARGSIELNMQLEELRANKKMGEDDPALVRDLESHKASSRRSTKSWRKN